MVDVISDDTDFSTYATKELSPIMEEFVEWLREKFPGVKIDERSAYLGIRMYGFFQKSASHQRNIGGRRGLKADAPVRKGAKPVAPAKAAAAPKAAKPAVPAKRGRPATAATAPAAPVTRRGGKPAATVASKPATSRRGRGGATVASSAPY